MEASNDNEGDAGNVLILWIVLNSILIVYAIGLFVYGKWFMPKDLTIYLGKLFNKFYKNIIEQKSLYARDDSNIPVDPKNEKLI